MSLGVQSQYLANKQEHLIKSDSECELDESDEINDNGEAHDADE